MRGAARSGVSSSTVASRAGAGIAVALSLLLSPLAARGDDAATKESCAATAERAQGERASRRLRAAREELVQCARAACPAVIRDDCARWLAEVEATAPTIVFRAHDERGQDLIDVTVDVDGARLATKLDGVAVTLDPGPHSVHFEAPGRKPAEVKVLVAEGDKVRPVVAELRAADEPRRVAEPAHPAPVSRALPWIAFGVGAASLGAFVALEVSGHAQLSDLDAGCGAKGTCTPEQVSPVRTRFQAAAVTLGVGVVGAVAGGVLLYLGSRDASRPTAWLRIAPTTAGGSLGVGGTF